MDDSTDLTLMFGTLVSMQGDLESAGSLESVHSLTAEVKLRSADVIVIDLNMPGNAIDAIRDLQEKLPACRVVVYSGDNQMNVAGAADRYGVDACVSKGTHPLDLLDAIRRVITLGQDLNDGTAAS